MVDWTDKSLPKFHPDKCVTMRVGKSKLPESQFYYRFNQDNLHIPRSRKLFATLQTISKTTY